MAYVIETWAKNRGKESWRLVNVDEDRIFSPDQLEVAEALVKYWYRDQKEMNEILQADYLKRLQAFVMDETTEDFEPRLPEPYNYRYKIGIYEREDCYY